MPSPESHSSPDDSPPRAWPGVEPLETRDAERLLGRDRELKRLVRLFKRPRSGQAPLVWLTGPAGAGKTSLVQAGLIPQLREAFEDSFECFHVVPEKDSGPDRVVDQIVEAVLSRSLSRGSSSGMDLQGRVRQFRMLEAQDKSEAIDYLASCYQSDVDGGGTDFLVFVDDIESMSAGGDVFPASDPEWLIENLDPLVRFLSELSFSGGFPCLVAVRSVNWPAIEASAKSVGSGNLGTGVEIDSLELDRIRAFFESAPARGDDEGEVRVSPELLEVLLSGGTSESLPFVSETLARLHQLDPDADELTTGDARWSGGIEATLAGIAESAVIGGEDSFFELMAALHPPGIYLATGKGDLKKRPESAAYLKLASDPDGRKLVDALVDARVLTLRAEAAGNAEIGWSLPDTLPHWPRAMGWLEENDRLWNEAEAFEAARVVWEKERRTPVKLLHSSKSVFSARTLLAYDDRRKILSGELREYLEKSVEFDHRRGADWNRRRWTRIALIGGGAVLALAVAVGLLIRWMGG